MHETPQEGLNPSPCLLVEYPRSDLEAFERDKEPSMNTATLLMLFCPT